MPSQQSLQIARLGSSSSTELCLEAECNQSSHESPFEQKARASLTPRCKWGPNQHLQFITARGGIQDSEEEQSGDSQSYQLNPSLKTNFSQHRSLALTLARSRKRRHSVQSKEMLDQSPNLDETECNEDLVEVEMVGADQHQENNDSQSDELDEERFRRPSGLH